MQSLLKAGRVIDRGEGPPTPFLNMVPGGGEVLTCLFSLGKGQDKLGSWTHPECTEFGGRKFKWREGRNTSSYFLLGAEPGGAA